MPVNYIHVRIISDEGDKPNLKGLLRKVHQTASDHLCMNGPMDQNTGTPDSILTTSRCYNEITPMRIEVEEKFPD